MPTTQAICWRPATTSCSSGWPAWSCLVWRCWASCPSKRWEMPQVVTLVLPSRLPSLIGRLLSGGGQVGRLLSGGGQVGRLLSGGGQVGRLLCGGRVGRPFSGGQAGRLLSGGHVGVKEFWMCDLASGVFYAVGKMLKSKHQLTCSLTCDWCEREMFSYRQVL